MSSPPPPSALLKRSETADGEKTAEDDALPELNPVMSRSDCILGQPHTPTIEVDQLVEMRELVFEAATTSPSNGSLLILDCRSLSEYNSGHINHSVQISLPGLIYKRLLKGTTSPLCVLPINALTLPARQKIQLDPAAVNVVVVASTASACPLTAWAHHHPRGDCHHSAQADFESASMTVGRLLVSRFTRLGCAASLLNGGFLAFQSRYSDLCSAAENDQAINHHIQIIDTLDSQQSSANNNNNSELSLANQHSALDNVHTVTEKYTALRPSQLGPLLSLANLTLSDSNQSNSTTTTTIPSNMSTVTVTRHSEVAATSSNSSVTSQTSSYSNCSNGTVTSDSSTGSSLPGTSSSASSSPRARMVFRACIMDNDRLRHDNSENEHMGLLPAPNSGHHSTPSRRLSSSAPAPCSPLLQPSYLNDAFEKCSGAMHSAFPVHIVDNVYLGNANNSVDRTVLDQHNIRYILNVTPNLPNQFADEKEFHYLQVPVSDHWSQSLIPSYMPQCIAFIHEARTNHCAVLIHCLAGISRSVTITVAYLMQTRNLSLDDAYDWVKQRKANIAPNFNFMGQLLDFERQLRTGSGSPDSGQFSSDEGESREAQAPAIRVDAGGPAQNIDIGSVPQLHGLGTNKPAMNCATTMASSKYSSVNNNNSLECCSFELKPSPIRLTQPPTGRKRQQKDTCEKGDEPRTKSPDVLLGAEKVVGKRLGLEADQELASVSVTQSKCIALESAVEG